MERRKNDPAVAVTATMVAARGGREEQEGEEGGVRGRREGGGGRRDERLKNRVLQKKRDQISFSQNSELTINHSLKLKFPLESKRYYLI